MSKSNVNPNHYKVAGRERQGEDIAQVRNKQKLAESEVRRRYEPGTVFQKPAPVPDAEPPAAAPVPAPKEKTTRKAAAKQVPKKRATAKPAAAKRVAAKQVEKKRATAKQPARQVAKKRPTAKQPARPAKTAGVTRVAAKRGKRSTARKRTR